MTKIILGLFKDSKMAGEAVGDLKAKGYAKEISVLAHDEKYEESEVHQVKQDVSTGAATGATIGAVTGTLAGVFSGISSIVVPGLGFLVGGPLAALLGLTGGALGSLGGGLLGALVDLGISEPTAEMYEKEIKKSQVLVGVSTEETTQEEVSTLLNSYGAVNVSEVNKKPETIL